MQVGTTGTGGSRQHCTYRRLWAEPTVDRRRSRLAIKMIRYTIPRHHGPIIYHLRIRAVSWKSILGWPIGWIRSILCWKCCQATDQRPVRLQSRACKHRDHARSIGRARLDRYGYLVRLKQPTDEKVLPCSCNRWIEATLYTSPHVARTMLDRFTVLGLIGMDTWFAWNSLRTKKFSLALAIGGSRQHGRATKTLCAQSCIIVIIVSLSVLMCTHGSGGVCWA